MSVNITDNMQVAANLSDLRYLVFQGMAGKGPRINLTTYHWEVYDNDTQSWVDTGVSAVNGAPGYTPTVSAEQTETGVLLTISDGRPSGTTASYFIPNGQDYVLTNADKQAISNLLIGNVPQLVTDWMDDNISGETTVVIDSSLLVQGAAADAKATGDALSEKIDMPSGGQTGQALLSDGSDGAFWGEAGIPEAVKTALLDCFENVAWKGTGGQTCYDALYAALYAETPVPERVTWSYNPASGRKLSEFTPYIVSGTATGNATESLVDGLLKLVSISTSSDGANFSYTFATTTNQHAKLYARVKFTSVPYNEAGNGFRLQVSNGTAGAVIFTRRTASNGTTCKFGTYVGNEYTDIADLVLGQWYEISVELSGSQQIITINGNSVFTGGLSTYYISQHRIMAQCGQNGGSIEADVSSVKFYDYD